MLNELRQIKNRDAPKAPSAAAINVVSPLGEAMRRAREIMDVAYLMQRAAFEGQVDTKFPFFFTQLNKIKLSGEKLIHVLGDCSGGTTGTRWAEEIARLELTNAELKEESERLLAENQRLRSELSLDKAQGDDCAEKQSEKTNKLSACGEIEAMAPAEGKTIPRAIWETGRESEKADTEIAAGDTVRTATFKHPETQRSETYEKRSDDMKTYISALEADIANLQSDLSMALHKDKETDKCDAC